MCCDDVCASDISCCDEGGWDAICISIASELCGEAYHVVTAEIEIDSPLTTFIERFTIQDGVANGLDTDELEGAGMLVLGDPGIIRCEFTKNVAYIGSGMSIKSGSNPIIVNCVFHENPPTGTSVTADRGGGLSSVGGTVQIINSLFYNNIVPGNGGAIYNEIGTCGQNPCGGIIDLINCTIADNEAGAGATGFGGGVYNTISASIDADNCIFYFNTDDSATVEAAQITDLASSSTVDYSDVEGDWSGTGTGNTDEDPDFIEGTGNYRLASTDSPCTDTGDNSAVECDLYDINNDGENCDAGTLGDNPDLDLNDRIGNGGSSADVDMGAYEFETCIWDLNGDCVVNTDDLLELFVQWGPDPAPADFDGDDDVDTADLLALFANWGPCYCATIGTVVLSFEDELDDACITEAEWDDYEDIMKTGSEAEKENYQCWMLHWINDCDRCTCLGQSGCPGNDPFGN